MESLAPLKPECTEGTYSLHNQHKSLSLPLPFLSLSDLAYSCSAPLFPLPISFDIGEGAIHFTGAWNTSKLPPEKHLSFNFHFSHIPSSGARSYCRRTVHTGSLAHPLIGQSPDLVRFRGMQLSISKTSTPKTPQSIIILWNPQLVPY